MRQRFVQVQTENGWELVPRDQYAQPERPDAPYVRGDYEPYVPVAGPEAEKWLKGDKDRKMIAGRKQHREYLRRHGFEEVGTEKKAFEQYAGKTRENYEYYNRRGSSGGWVGADYGRLTKR